MLPVRINSIGVETVHALLDFVTIVDFIQHNVE